MLSEEGPQEKLARRMQPGCDGETGVTMHERPVERSEDTSYASGTVVLTGTHTCLHTHRLSRLLVWCGKL